MRVHSSALLAGVLCLFAAVASADIARVSPTAFAYGSEDFINIYGSSLLGSVATEVVFDDLYAVEPSSATNEHLLVFVPAGIMFEPGQHTLYVRSIDDAGVRTSNTVTFTVNDLPTGGPPLISIPEGVVAEAENRDGAVVTYFASAISPNGDPLDITCTPVSGSHFPMGVTSVSCSATNAEGTTTRGFLVFVTDTVAPVLTLPEDITTDNPVVTWSATAVDAVDGDLPVTCNPPSGSTFTQSLTTVRCFAVDSHANRVDGTFRVRITGQGALILPDDIEAEATSPAGAVVTYVATDDNGGPATCTPASGSTFPLGVTVVTCTAGAATGTFNVTVVDTTAPVLTLPSLVEAEATSADGAIVTWVATATDLVSGDVTVECLPASGSLFPLGVTGVGCQAIDAAGNSGGGFFQVTVSDTTPPAIVNVVAIPNILWPPNHKMTSVVVTATAVDAVDPSPSAVTILSVTSNQPINGTGDGDVAPDWVITGPMSLQLRAERAGSQERIYTITLQSTDAAGNVGTATVTVRVTEPAKRRSART